MQGIKSCYTARTTSLEIAEGTLLRHGSPEQLLEAHTKKNTVVLPCRDQLHQGHGSGNRATSRPRQIIRPHGISKAVTVFQYSEVFGQFGHRKKALKKFRLIAN